MVGSDGAPALQWVRIGLGLAAAGLLMALVLRAWRIPSSMLAELIVWLLALLASAGSPTWSGGPPAETPHAAGDAGVPVPSRSGTRPGSSSP